MNSFVIRSALVVLALLIGAWLALGVRAVALENDSRAVMTNAGGKPIPEDQLNAALDDLAKAGRLSPDQGPVIRQGELLEAAGHGDRAREVAKQVTENEPDNLQGWFLAWVVADTKSSKAHALARLNGLNPWFAYALKRR